ncbi:DUF4174 domain-containing protein [Arenibacter algicola]|uniref:DUF4174 domain-containing protein n=1 Tax=Arenibacter algicola TaxID=616991 RepID=UPI0004DECFB3|nr:DUF4174 domain-containing protein [Arenibacter algicola]
MVVETQNNIIRSGFIFLGILMINYAHGQDLNKHLWKNRVLLIMSQNENSKEYQDQIAEFYKFPRELKERKMLIYHVLPQRYTLIKDPVDPEQNEWVSSSALFDKFAGKNVDFKVVLIGLDGGNKLEKNGLLSAEELFGP